MNALPARGHGLQRRRWQRPLAAVVEVDLVGQCWTEIAEVVPLCVGQGRRPKGTSAIVKARADIPLQRGVLIDCQSHVGKEKRKEPG